MLVVDLRLDPSLSERWSSTVSLVSRREAVWSVHRGLRQGSFGVGSKFSNAQAQLAAR